MKQKKRVSSKVPGISVHDGRGVLGWVLGARGGKKEGFLQLPAEVGPGRWFLRGSASQNWPCLQCSQSTRCLRRERQLCCLLPSLGRSTRQTRPAAVRGLLTSNNSGPSLTLKSQIHTEPASAVGRQRPERRRPGTRHQSGWQEEGGITGASHAQSRCPLLTAGHSAPWLPSGTPGLSSPSRASNASCSRPQLNLWGHQAQAGQGGTSHEPSHRAPAHIPRLLQSPGGARTVHPQWTLLEGALKESRLTPNQHAEAEALRVWEVPSPEQADWEGRLGEREPGRRHRPRRAERKSSWPRERALRSWRSACRQRGQDPAHTLRKRRKPEQALKGGGEAESAARGLESHRANM